MKIIASTQPKSHFFGINNYKIKNEYFINNKQIIEFKTFKANAKAMEYDFDELLDSKIQKKIDVKN